MKACAFFGNQDCSPIVVSKLKRLLRILIELKQVTRFYIGNEGQFNAVVRGVLSELKEKYPFICCYVVLTCHADNYANHDSNKEEKMVLPERIEKAPQGFMMFHRNIWMIQHADYIITNIKQGDHFHSILRVTAKHNCKILPLMHIP